MAEKAPPRKRPTATAAKQQMLESLAETTRAVQQRREAEARPEERLAERAVQQSIATADALSTEGIVKSVGELRSAVGKTLAQLSDRLEEEVGKYVQIQRAIMAKEAELKEIYEVQRSASTLTALIETQQKQRDEFEREMAEERESLTREIEQTRAEWDAERKARESEAKERDAIDQKKREREREEYRYAFAREQQLAKDQFADEMAKAERALAERKAQSEKELAERERAIAAREEELNDLRKRTAAFPKELDAAVAKAARDALAASQADAAGREELLKRDFAGERNVLTTRIASLEQTVKEQAAQLQKLAQQSEKAYAQVQDIAVKAIEGSSNSRSLASLQQILAEQGRKPGAEK